MRRQILVMAIVLVATLVTGCGQTGADGVTRNASGGRDWPPYRYRLSVEVNTPQGLRTGSSVIEVRVHKAGQYTIPSPGSIISTLRGEAVAVDLPHGRTLYALLRSEEDADWAKDILQSVIKQQTINDRLQSPDPFATDMERILALRGTQELPRVRSASGRPTGATESSYPLLVAFTNDSDPRTIKRVDPEIIQDNFGTGITLRRIIIERTNDPVTVGIERRLRWLPTVNEKLRGSNFNPKGIPVGDFQRLFSTELER